MAITKTKFINYVRCPRYVSLDKLKKEKLDSTVTIEEYRREEEEAYLTELLSDMYDEENNDLIDVKNEHLEVMLPYYNQVELLAGNLASKYFEGTFKYSKDTYHQESFDCKINGILYLCYVDIYNELDDNINIIEVKATTSNTFTSIGRTFKDEFGKSQTESIFIKNEAGIYVLLEEAEINIEDYMKIDKYYQYKEKLFNRYTSAGHYVYDLAVQRYIVERDLKLNHGENKANNTKYYLAVLNAEYLFDGTYIDDEPVYNTDINGNEIVSFIDLTSITKDYMDIIDLDRKRVETYIRDLKVDPVDLGIHCENKKTTHCKYQPICWKHIPNQNSIFAYLGNHHGFKDEMGNKYDRFDLIKEGKVSMIDVPSNYLNRENNQVQRNVVETNESYINKNKIIDGLKQINYPIYHLDFETFPCPLPRFQGEKCYTQSVFQFSLHIETKEGVCDKEKDHYEYLANSHEDLRETLIQKMIEWIDIENGGTILVYNQAFEKTRLKELAEIFPKYRKQLMKMREMIFDLMYLVNTNSSLYKELGYSDEEAKLFNYYDSKLNGSFSIKKVLPIFSNLTYKGMEIGNGIEAMVTYANYPKLSPKDFEHKYHKLIEYCKQDTWAMVKVLEGLRKSVL
ncbi:MAG: DUF2779 domain-containing protein [Bacilli bacterium]|nr:DUF2779 domain-containing protein [Bacilli bacterium]MDD4808826.1 DUF2779 domain-containing protein [Bacilli bacterium]